jgi:hypothetical protein
MVTPLTGDFFTGVLLLFIMLFNVSVWVNHYDWDIDVCDIVCGTYVAQQYTDLPWSDVCAVGDTWSMTPGQSNITVTPA